ncbi:hypothetical protein [Spirochaeta dissipatitropha]
MAVLSTMILATAVYASDISPGSFQGTLTTESNVDDTGRAYTEYRLQLNAGETVFVSLESEEFDTYLILTPPDGQSQANDDFREMGTDSGLFYQPENESTVDLRVTSFSREEYGDYLLKITPIETIPITGSSIEGRLESDNDDLLFSAYSYTATDYAELSIDLQSSDFDTYLYVLLPGGNLLVNDDADWNTSDSRLLLPVAPEDRLLIIAGSYSGHETGDFEIRLEEREPAVVSDERELTIDRELLAYLHYGEEQFNGKPSLVFSIDLIAGQAIQIDMMSDNFDAYLSVTGPYDFFDYDDDSGAGTNARLQFTTPESGTYQIYASSFFSDGFGLFSILASEWEDFHYSADAMVWTGILNHRAPMDNNGHLYNEHSIQLEAGETVRVIAESDDFDTVLVLLDPSGRTVAENDDYYGSNSMIEYRAERGGLFNTRVRSFGSAGGGRYTITAEIIN